MANIQVDVDIDLSQVYEGLEERKSEVLDIIQRYVEDACPVRTGHMRSTIGQGDYDVHVDCEYASYTEYRTNWFSKAIDNSIGEVNKLWQSQD